MLRLRRERAAAAAAPRGSGGGGGRRWPRLAVPALLARRNLPALVVTLHLTVVRVFCGFVTGAV